MTAIVEASAPLLGDQSETTDIVEASDPLLENQPENVVIKKWTW